MKDIDVNSVCLTYLQETRRKVNDFIHKKKNPEMPKYFVGMIVKAKTHMGKGKSKIHVNCDFRITDLTEEKVELTGGDTVATLNRSVLDTHFALPYARTVHSIQGKSFQEDTVIFDAYFYRAMLDWIFVALTRNRSGNVFVCTDIKSVTLDTTRYPAMIDGYKDQDRTAGREWTANYITVNWMKEQSRVQGHQCNRCGQVMNYRNVLGDDLNMTVDRHNNSIAHIKSNCCLMCYKCNISKK